MSTVLTAILSRWGSDRPGDPAHMRSHYIDHPESLLCAVAHEQGQVIGFQSLKRAWPGNPYDVPVGWGVIGTYVVGAWAGRGVGRALFAGTKRAAREAGLPAIDATIGGGNTAGLAYYEAMGFRTWRRRPGVVCKRFVVG